MTPETMRLVIAAAVVIAVVLFLRRLFASKPEPRHLVPARCASCGWTGSVSKHAPKCPRCANRITL